jgi:hypothetical protein
MNFKKNLYINKKRIFTKIIKAKNIQIMFKIKVLIVIININQILKIIKSQINTKINTKKINFQMIRVIKIDNPIKNLRIVIKIEIQDNTENQHKIIEILIKNHMIKIEENPIINQNIQIRIMINIVNIMEIIKILDILIKIHIIDNQVTINIQKTQDKNHRNIANMI